MCKYPTKKSKAFPIFTIEKSFESAKFTLLLTKCVLDSKQYIFKTYSQADDYSHNSYIRENRIHSSLNHQNIIQYNSNPNISFSIPNYDVISMEYAPFGDFFDLILDYNFADEKLIRTYFHQLIEGIQYLHNKQIAHLDIKLENLLLGKDYLLKVADFDLAQNIHETVLISKGTANYRAPEVKSGNCTDFYSADIYSIGICLYILIAGSFPFLEEDDNQAQPLFRYDMFLQNNDAFWEENEAILDGKFMWSKNLRDLLNKMWAQNPSERITLEQVKKSNWYNEPVYTNDELQALMKVKLSNSSNQ